MVAFVHYRLCDVDGRGKPAKRQCLLRPTLRFFRFIAICPLDGIGCIVRLAWYSESINLVERSAMHDVEVLPAPGMVEFRQEATNALLAGRRVLILDDLWTLALASLSPDDPAGVEGELPVLRRVVEDLSSAIFDAGEAARRFGFLLDETTSDNQLDEAVDALALYDPAIRLNLDVILAEDFESDWELRGAVIAACSYFREEADREIEEINNKLARIVAGEFQEGDIHFPSRCALYLLCAGAGISLTVGAVVATGGAGAALVGVAVEVGRDILSWKDSKCGQAYREITRGRRD